MATVPSKIFSSACCTLTEAGYVGDDVENILLRLVQAADYDIEQRLLHALTGHIPGNRGILTLPGLCLPMKPWNTASSIRSLPSSKNGFDRGAGPSRSAPLRRLVFVDGIPSDSR